MSELLRKECPGEDFRRDRDGVISPLSSQTAVTVWAASPPVASVSVAAPRGPDDDRRLVPARVPGAAVTLASVWVTVTALLALCGRCCRCQAFPEQRWGRGKPGARARVGQCVFRREPDAPLVGPFSV